ncbi:Gfo/Idh/MocA family protein [Novipirellula artificiosorum]|uniref:Oxidoreductase family, NAD-binding Rossmann fold n=1 Tax=Novipirellula artificiosorum TaxID=2528016 RepID=A0A5C6D2H9_9BACT|nr:Gfo/Idh/MocA family oxidoreductase [Novipirellula artificiosorum]TWU31393.1 Oxidoreductase family, NAD-binding Rossmann fold [Novipirellula artificiosorum]
MRIDFGIYLLVLTTFAIPTNMRIHADEPESHHPETLRLGIIGLDTSHATAFTQEFNRDEASDPALVGLRVVAAYPHGSPDIESSTSRIPKLTAEMEALGVEITESIADLLTKVDCVLLETNDGRIHFEQALEVFRAGKPVFIDKPIGSNLAEALAIFRAAEHYKTPMFSSSSLRFSSAVQRVRAGDEGPVLGCSSYSPCSLEKTHVDLFWYGIHGVELLYTCMGTGCVSVSHTSSNDFEFSVGRWADGRIGTFRGIRSGKTGYGGTAFCSQGIQSIGPYEGYKPLVIEIGRFFRSLRSPIEPTETIELYAFMQAAMLSKQRGGNPVHLAEVMADADAEASVILSGRLGP